MTRSPIVNRVVLEPALIRRDYADEIASRLARFAHDRLPVLLQEALSDFGADRIERLLDRFEIDLGAVTLDRLEQTLEERFTSVLRARLIDRFGMPLALDDDGGKQARTERDALATYPAGPAGSVMRAGAADAQGSGGEAHLRPGSGSGDVCYQSKTKWEEDAGLAALAGWFEGRVTVHADEFNRLFTAALAASAHDVALLLREYGRGAARRERMVATLEPSVRARAVHALRPTDAQQVLGDVNRFSVRHRAAPVVAMRQDDFDDALWQTVFAYLLADRGSRFNRRAFLGSLLARLAAHAGVAYTTLLDSLLDQVGGLAYAIVRDEPLHDILTHLRSNAAPVRRQPGAPLFHAGRSGDASARDAAADHSETDETGGTVDVEVFADAPRPEADAGSANGVDNRELEALDFYLDQGAWPWFAASDAEPAELAIRLARHAPLRLTLLLRRSDSTVGPDVRLVRLAGSLDARRRNELIGFVEPTASRRIVASLEALESLIEQAAFSVSQRAALRRGLTAATLERMVAVRVGAFDERAWLAYALAHASRAAGQEPDAGGEALLLATHGDAARRSRTRWIRARLVDAGVAGGADQAVTTDDPVDAAMKIAWRAVRHSGALRPQSLDRQYAPLRLSPSPGVGERAKASTRSGHIQPLVRAFVAAWPALARALHVSPGALDAVAADALGITGHRSATQVGDPRAAASAQRALDFANGTRHQALRRASGKMLTPDTLFAVLNRLALMHGIPLRRWFAALASAREWRDADPGLALLRRWRTRLAEQDPLATSGAPRFEAPALLPPETTGAPSPQPHQTAGAAASFVHFVTSGVRGQHSAHWFTMPSAAWLDAALRDDTVRVAVALRACSPDENLLRRLAQLLWPIDLERLATALEPALSTVSLGLLRTRVGIGSKLLRPPEVALLERAVFAALLAPSAARTSAHVFVERVLEGLARRLDTTPADLADVLARVVTNREPALCAALLARSNGGQADPDAARVDAGIAVRTNQASIGSTAPARPERGYAQAWRQVAAFMRHGEQPHEAGASLYAAFAQLAAAAPRLLARVLRESATIEPAHTRLASLDTGTFALIARAAVPRRPSAVIALQSVAAGFDTHSARSMTANAHAAWLRHAARGSVRDMLADLVEDTIRGAGHGARTVLARWRRAVRTAGAGRDLEHEWQAWLGAREALMDAASVSATKSGIRLAGGLSASILARSAPKVGATTAEGKRTARTREEFQKESSEKSARPPATPGDAALWSKTSSPEPTRQARSESQPIYVANAGIVLLWPFLSRYFELLGLIQDHGFIDFDARSRAVYLLHWLASGHSARHEAELPLAKVMCGVTPPIPLAAGAQRDPDARERAVSEELLGGVRQNWDKLRNTTADGLRESFLMRNGRLRRDDGVEREWSLIVEARAYDVLLDTLPWRISMIRMSWMTDLLKIQWRQ